MLEDIPTDPAKIKEYDYVWKSYSNCPIRQQKEFDYFGRSSKHCPFLQK